MWKILKNKDGTWEFHSQPYKPLAFDKNGSVFVTSNVSDANSQFILEKWSGTFFFANYYIRDQLCLIVFIHRTFTADASVDGNPPPEVSRLLTAGLEGIHCIKTSHGTFLRAWKGLRSNSDWHIGVSPQCGQCERWHFEDHHAKASN